MPKIVLFGGSGDMGQGILEDILTHDAGVQLAVFDINLAGARQALERIGASADRAELIEGDITDKGAVAAALKSADVAVSAVGPFYRFGFEVASTVLSQGVSFVDICDDGDAIQAELSLSRLAERKGATAVVGMGWTPGLSNVLVSKLCAGLDSVDVDIYWVGSTTDSEGTAVIGHVFHVINRDAPMYHDGSWTAVKAVTGHEDVEFPAPIGKVSTYYVGHPEPLTIPLHLDVKNVNLKGALIPDEMNSIAKLLDDLGFLTEENKIRALMRGLHPLLPQLSKVGGKAPPVSGLVVKVSGNQGGTEVTRTAACVDSMRRLTGIPPAIVAMQIAAGKIRTPGVYPPEGAVDPDAFLAALADRQVEVEVR